MIFHHDLIAQEPIKVIVTQNTIDRLYGQIFTDIRAKVFQAVKKNSIPVYSQEACTEKYVPEKVATLGNWEKTDKIEEVVNGKKKKRDSSYIVEMKEDWLFGVAKMSVNSFAWYYQRPDWRTEGKWQIWGYVSNKDLYSLLTPSEWNFIGQITQEIKPVIPAHIAWIGQYFFKTFSGMKKELWEAAISDRISVFRDEYLTKPIKGSEIKETFYLFDVVRLKPVPGVPEFDYDSIIPKPYVPDSIQGFAISFKSAPGGEPGEVKLVLKAFAPAADLSNSGIPMPFLDPMYWMDYHAYQQLLTTAQHKFVMQVFQLILQEKMNADCFF